MAVDVIPVASGFTLLNFLNGSGGFADNLITILFAVAGGAGVIYITWAGVRYITAGASAEKTKTARQGIVNAVIGIVIAMSAFAIIRFATLSSRLGESVATGNFKVSTPAPRPTNAPTSGGNPAVNTNVNGSSYLAVAQLTLGQYRTTRVVDDDGKPIASGSGQTCELADYAQPNICKVCYQSQTNRCLSSDFQPGTGVSIGGKFDELSNCIGSAAYRSDIYSCLQRHAGNSNGAEWICRLYLEHNPGKSQRDCPYDK
jgi:hypothetical protein